jgi:hypothetical protein
VPHNLLARSETPRLKPVTDPPERDAVEAPPWTEAMGPRPRVTSWPSGKRPTLRIRVGGEWRRAEVLQRQDFADGRVRYLCDVWMPNDVGGTTAIARGYWWDGRAMRTG